MVKHGVDYKTIVETWLEDKATHENKAPKKDEKWPTKENGFYIKPDGTDKRIRDKPDYDGLSDYLIKEKYLKCDDSRVYIWKGKSYKSISFLALKNITNELIKPNESAQMITNFYNKALIKSYVDFEEYREPVGYLNCNNGLLNVRSGKLVKHDPKNFIRYVLDHDYNKDAKCPIFTRSLELVTNGDKELQKLIAQVFGYCIAGGHPLAHKAFMFYGEGGNGKSTILTALSNLVGSANAARIPLTLFDKPFSMISLDGKLVNLIDETPKFNINPEAFKNVVSGGYVRAAHKGKPEVDLKVNARIVFACNKLPNFKDDSDGMIRRLVVIPFNHRIKDIEADKNIDYKIGHEMSGILNFALEGLRDLIENNYNFADGAATKDAFEQYKVESDSVYYFFTEHTEFLDGPNGAEIFNSTSDLYNSYKTMCKAEGLYALGMRMFSNTAGKYYKKMYRSIDLNLENKDRQLFGQGRGIKRFRVKTKAYR